MHKDRRNPLPGTVGKKNKPEENSGMYLRHRPLSSFGDCFYSSCWPGGKQIHEGESHLKSVSVS